MTPYMKRFVYASLFYLGLAAVFGILNGTLNLGYFGSFAHTHFSLLGFMAMIVFGIGYFILPRFNGSELRFDSWVPVHFWLANISLMGMVVFRGLTIETGHDIYHILFIVAASLQVVSIFMFILNIWLSLTPPQKPAVEVPRADSGPSSASIPGSFEVVDPGVTVNINAQTPVAYLVDTLGSLKQVLIDKGLKPLAMPGHIDMVRAKGVTLGTAVKNHGMNFDEVVSAVRQEMEKNGFVVTTTSADTVPSAKVKLAPTTLIGEVIKTYPASREVFQKHFGSGCFECPGQAYESIDMACRMHGVNPQNFLRELNEILG